MEDAQPAPDPSVSGQLVVAWHQGLNAGAWRAAALDPEGLQLPRPEPLLDVDTPVALKLRVGRAPPIRLVARVDPFGGSGPGPRLCFGAVGPAQAAALLAMAQVSSTAVAPLEILERGLSEAMDQLESDARQRSSPSRNHLVFAVASLLLVIGAAVGLLALG